MKRLKDALEMMIAAIDAGKTPKEIKFVAKAALKGMNATEKLFSTLVVWAFDAAQCQLMPPLTPKEFVLASDKDLTWLRNKSYEVYPSQPDKPRRRERKQRKKE